MTLRAKKTKKSVRIFHNLATQSLVHINGILLSIAERFVKPLVTTYKPFIKLKAIICQPTLNLFAALAPFLWGMEVTKVIDRNGGDENAHEMKNAVLNYQVVSLI